MTPSDLSHVQQRLGTVAHVWEVARGKSHLLIWNVKTFIAPSAWIRQVKVTVSQSSSFSWYFPLIRGQVWAGRACDRWLSRRETCWAALFLRGNLTLQFHATMCGWKREAVRQPVVVMSVKPAWTGPILRRDGPSIIKSGGAESVGLANSEPLTQSLHTSCAVTSPV